jgi:nucleoid-associated protein Lsr2
MAQKVVVEVTDDIDGGKAAETVTFGLDGRAYTIDLSARNARALRKVLAPYIESGRRVRTGSPGRGRSRTAAARTTSSTQQVREWARSQGIEVADRGRIPSELAARYQAAHGS